MLASRQPHQHQRQPITGPNTDSRKRKSSSVDASSEPAPPAKKQKPTLDLSSAGINGSNTLYHPSLPAEIWNRIYAQILSIQPGLEPPAMLKYAPMRDRLDLLPLYRKVNHVVRHSTVPTLRKLGKKRLLEIQHMYMIWEGDSTIMRKTYSTCRAIRLSCLINSPA